jgi:threonylcarbamoyladenosine tRNA methylthiotransferase MtaB
LGTVAFYTLGCKVNQYETELIREQFLANGYKIVPFSNLADIYVINTCTVTAKSDRKCRYYIQTALKRAPLAPIIVTGCYVDNKPRELSRISPRIVIVPNKEKKNLIRYILKHAAVPEIPVISTFKGHARVFVKIQDGCDAYCAYCVVPYVRNVLSSRPVGEILTEVNNLVNNGYREIVLTGIRLGKFRMKEEGARGKGSPAVLLRKTRRGDEPRFRDKEGTSDLVRLIRLIHGITGLERIRLSSIEPIDVTDELIETMASLPKLCHHLHIPLQSGDDKVLALMKRAYNSRQYLTLIDKIRDRIPDINITADVIVGFPGEEDKNFAQSYKFIKNIGFGRLHVFRFSPREGTAAAGLKYCLNAQAVQKRSQALLDLSTQLSKRFNHKFLNKITEILPEGKSKKTGFTSGLTGNYIRVLIEQKTPFSADLVKVRITKIEEEYVLGTLIE